MSQFLSEHEDDKPLVLSGKKKAIPLDKNGKAMLAEHIPTGKLLGQEDLSESDDGSSSE